MPDSAIDRRFVRVDLEYRLCRPGGWRTPGTQGKTWFFEVPAVRLADEAWLELLNRIVYDSNVAMRRREPGDDAWLGLDAFRTSPVEAAEVLAWKGPSDAEGAPWVAAHRAMLWEPGPCYFVDDEGRYDVMGGNDFTELLLHRLLLAGRVDAAEFEAFFDRCFGSGKGKAIHEDRARRFGNLVEVRATGGGFRKAPGAEPWESGPVDPSHLA